VYLVKEGRGLVKGGGKGKGKGWGKGNTNSVG
jgi:hypothetical protein